MFLPDLFFKFSNKQHIIKFFFYISLLIYILFWSSKYLLGFDLRYILAVPLIISLLQFKSNNFYEDIKIIFFCLLFICADFILTHNFSNEFDIYYKLLSYCALLIIAYISFKNFPFIKEIIEELPIVFLIIYIFLTLFAEFSHVKSMSFFSSCIINKLDISHPLYSENSHYAFYGVGITNYFLYKFSCKINFLNFIKLIIILIISFYEFSFTYIFSLLFTSILIVFYFIILKNNFKTVISFLILIIFSIIVISSNRGCLIRITDISHYSNSNTAIEEKLSVIDELFIKKYTQVAEGYEENQNEILKKIQQKEFTVVGNIPNHSTAIVLHNLQVAFKIFTDNIYGSGFNSYYLGAKKYANNVFKPVPRVENYNFNDGSSNFNKLLGELGILNIIFLIFGYLFIRNKAIPNATKILVFSIITTQLFRGAGYFNGGFLIFIFFMILSYFKYETSLKINGK